jgi:hypothetical protein
LARGSSGTDDGRELATNSIGASVGGAKVVIVTSKGGELASATNTSTNVASVSIIANNGDEFASSSWVTGIGGAWIVIVTSNGIMLASSTAAKIISAMIAIVTVDGGKDTASKRVAALSVAGVSVITVARALRSRSFADTTSVDVGTEASCGGRDGHTGARRGVSLGAEQVHAIVGASGQSQAIQANRGR